MDNNIPNKHIKSCKQFEILTSMLFSQRWTASFFMDPPFEEFGGYGCAASSNTK